MELDELKKSWNALDAQLQKEPIADEQQIKELIANYKTNTRHSLAGYDYFAFDAVKKFLFCHK